MDAVTLRRLRCAAQGLAEPVADPVERLLAVPAQDERAAWTAIDVRGGAPDPDALAVTWLHRGTLHLVRAEDLPWLHGLLAPQRAAAHRRRLAELGVPEGRWREVAAAAADAPQSRDALAALLGVRGPALAHLVGRAALEGRVVLRARDRAVVGAALPAALDGEERERALRALGRRYLAGHAPADARDLARWSGLPLGDARRALAGAVAPSRAARPVPRRVLGAYDPYLLGWTDRAFAVPPALAREVHPGGGVLRPVVVEDGLVVAVA